MVTPETADTEPIADWLNRLVELPDVFPHQLNLIQDTVRLVKLSAAERKAASFLDHRSLTPNTISAWFPWQSVSDAVKSASHKKNPNYIFHTSHCGSTLISRLLEFAPDTECLREPLALITLAQDMADSRDGRAFLTEEEQRLRLQTLSTLWIRGADHTIVKTTSVCTDLMPHVLSVSPGAKAIFIYNQLETHLETLLAHKNSLTSLKVYAQLEIQRLRQITGLDVRLDRLTLGQFASLRWLSETTRVAITLEEFSSQIALVEFDSFLQKPEEALLPLLRHLNIPATEETVRNATSSSVMRTYSKAPEHAYAAKTRSDILADARTRFKQEIRDGLRWIEDLSGKSATVDQALQKFNR